MKKIVPFSKELPFKTRIAEITDIEVTHNLKREEENTISGTFKVAGTYKMTDASQIEEQFEYELPFIIEVDSKYSIENVDIKISDFYFEIINEDTLKINIEIELDNVEEKILERCYDETEENYIDDNHIDDNDIDLEITEDDLTEKDIDTNEEQIEDEIMMDIKENTEDYMETLNIKDEVESIDINDQQPKTKLNTSRPITDIFTSINDNEDTFKTYHVYIVRENDTLESIMNKYKIDKDKLQEYNDLNEIKIGTKLIIPATNE